MRRLALAVVLAGCAATAGAQLYRWTDEKGKVHFGDTPPPAGARNVEKKSLARGEPGATESLPFILQQPMKEFPVTFYSAPSCEACAPARQLLNARGIPFKEISVRSDEQIVELNRAVGANVVPAVLVGSTIIKGFDEGAYHRALDIAGYPKPGALPARAQVEPKALAKPEEKKPDAEPAPAKKGPYYSPER
ncbi:MAG TPA: glutaredoxin family protein [Burkholderiales bacterium]|nr:glutaredoxin family protein [Burkholderiales bacterium]